MCVILLTLRQVLEPVEERCRKGGENADKESSKIKYNLCHLYNFA